MSPAIRPQVAMPCLLKERQCPFAYTSQTGEHDFLVGKLRRSPHDRRHLALGHTRFNQSQRNVQALVERYGQRRFPDDTLGEAPHAALDVRKVGYEFGGRPAIRSRLLAPLWRVYRVNRPQQRGFGACQLGKNRLQVSHASFCESNCRGPWLASAGSRSHRGVRRTKAGGSELRDRLQTRSARLLERMGELQDA